MSAMSFDPNDRPSSAIEFAQRLGAGSAMAIAVSVGVTPSPRVVAEGSLSIRFDVVGDKLGKRGLRNAQFQNTRFTPLFPSR